MSFSQLLRHFCDVPPSIQAERHPTRRPAGAVGARVQADQAGQQPRGPAAGEEKAVTTVSAVTHGSGAAVSSVSSLWEACADHGAD